MNELTALTFGLQAFVTLLVILDPPGAAPLFLSLVGGRDRREQVRMAWLAAATSLLIITIFAIFGQFIVDYLEISISALQGAGGLLLLLISLDLLKGIENDPAKSGEKNVALVPLGTPLLAGPGAIVTIMLFASRVEGTDTAIGLAGA
jgi:multiple antibiotic resistance protein